MCGIIGFNWKDGKRIKEGLEIIEHRGPDDKGHLIGKFSMATCRLSIMDLSKKGHQPMTREERTIVFNGEIYNFKEIREELEEYEFKSDSDTEVILYAYDKWGAKCLDKFNGMFAFCIYDTKKDELFLARDRLGIKPFYYIHEKKGKNTKFAFCSEIKGLLGFLEKKEVDPEGLKQFFTFGFTLEETTMVKGVRKMLPGHWMRFDLKTGHVSKKKWYELKKHVESKKSFSEHKRLVKEKLDKAVERRMVADVPVACLLSGGIDSSVITALAKKYGKKKLNTFSIGFDDTSETKYSTLVAEHLGTKHQEFKVGKDNILEYLDDMAYHMDEPIADAGFLPIFVLSKKVSQHNKVVLSGDGADEIFTGYDRYKMFHYGRYLRHFAFPFLPTFGMNIFERLKAMRGKDEYHAFLEIIRLFGKDELHTLKVEEHDASGLWKEDYEKSVMNAQRFDIRTLLPGDFFMKADEMSSAFGLEQRVPFMDHELVELAFQIPLKHKLKWWEEKRVLKKAFEDLLPEKITKRRKYAFFVPIDYWFQNVLADRLEELLKKSKHGLYDKKLIYKLLKKMKTKKRGNYKEEYITARKLWAVLMFEMWYENFIEN